MSFPRYPEYKPSGVEWLGDVPEHWEVKRLKFTAPLVTERAETRCNPIALENIEGWTGTLVPTDSQFEGEGTQFRTGDILFGKLRPYLAKIHLATRAGEAVGDFHVVRPTSDVYGKFLQHSMLRREFIDIIDGTTFGSKMPRASWEALGGMPTALPPLPEQRAIAAFLDRETAKINGLVAEQQRLIELLKEKRQAVISHAVTKGLDPKAPMKPSGVEWLGDVPAHWVTRKLTRAFQTIGSGTTPRSDNLAYYEPGHVPWVNTGDLTDGELSSCEKLVSLMAVEDYPSLRVYPAGSLLVAMYGATTGKLGLLGFDATVNQACCAFVGNDLIRARFLFYWLLGYRTQLLSLASGGGQPNISQEVLRGLRVAAPTPAEQDRIVEYLLDASAQADTLIAQAESAITLLQERRSALISAAVTGQIDVRNTVATEAA